MVQRLRRDPPPSLHPLCGSINRHSTVDTPMITDPMGEPCCVLYSSSVCSDQVGLSYKGSLFEDASLIAAHSLPPLVHSLDTYDPPDPFACAASRPLAIAAVGSTDASSNMLSARASSADCVEFWSHRRASRCSAAVRPERPC